MCPLWLFLVLAVLMPPGAIKLAALLAVAGLAMPLPEPERGRR